MSSENNTNDSNVQDPSEEGNVIQGHQYDGIQEYDNPMPGWWTAMFWATGIFAIIYLIGLKVDWIDTYEEDLDESLMELAAIRADFESDNPTVDVDSTMLAAAAADPARVEAGKTLFAGQCAVCHAADGGGLIGPNLTDQYWLHGGSDMDIFEIIRVGVPEKGMAPWESIYTEDERVDLTAFIRSLENTTPANPKEPQGELVTS